MFYAMKVMGPSSSHSQAVLPNSGTLVLDRIDRHDKEFEIFVSTSQPPICPLCQQISSAHHSGYTRSLGDLPWQGLSVRISVGQKRSVTSDQLVADSLSEHLAVRSQGRSLARMAQDLQME